MIIDFTNRLTEEKVQEMIDVSLMDFTGYTGVINLSSASAAEIKKAFENPDRWLCSINYSGETYLEQYRTAINSGESYDVFFYVVGAEADSYRKRIYDRILWANVIPSTGEVEIGLSDYVPSVIYNLDNMNTEQMKVLRSRAQTGGTNYPNKYRFAAIWTYNGRNYMSCARDSQVSTNGFIIGSSLDNGSIYYDRVVIYTNGTVAHYEYTTNITLTAVQ